MAIIEHCWKLAFLPSALVNVLVWHVTETNLTSLSKRGKLSKCSGGGEKGEGVVAPTANVTRD